MRVKKFVKILCICLVLLILLIGLLAWWQWDKIKVLYKAGTMDEEAIRAEAESHQKQYEEVLSQYDVVPKTLTWEEKDALLHGKTLDTETEETETETETTEPRTETIETSGQYVAVIETETTPIDEPLTPQGKVEQYVQKTYTPVSAAASRLGPMKPAKSDDGQSAENPLKVESPTADQPEEFEDLSQYHVIPKAPAQEEKENPRKDQKPPENYDDPDPQKESETPQEAEKEPDTQKEPETPKETEKEPDTQKEPETPKETEKEPDTQKEPETPKETETNPIVETPTAQSIIDECVQELYNRESSLMSQLGTMMQAAIDEWNALGDKQSSNAKYDIATRGLRECYKLEGQVDAEVKAILNKCEKKLKIIKADTSIIDTLWQQYCNEKESTKAYYLDKYL